MKEKALLSVDFRAERIHCDSIRQLINRRQILCVELRRAPLTSAVLFHLRVYQVRHHARPPFRKLLLVVIIAMAGTDQAGTGPRRRRPVHKLIEDCADSVG